MRKGCTAIAAVLSLALLIGCGGDDTEGEASAQLPEGCGEVEAPEPKAPVKRSPPRGGRFEPLQSEGLNTAVVETNCGAFEIRLDIARAPKTTSSFASLVAQDFYDGTTIHRIEPGFVIQGGDPLGDGTGGPGYSVDEPPPQDLSYTRGIVAMAKTEAEPPGRSGSQFFVVTAPADAGLPPDFALLGRVTEGFDAVERIEQLGGAGGEPLAPVMIERITLASK